MKKKIIFLLAVSLVFLAFLRINSFANMPLSVKSRVVIELKSGDSVHSLVVDLINKKIITCGFCARVYLRLNKKSVIVVPGEYVLKPKMTLKDLLSQLEQREIVEYKITLIEGWTLKQALHAIWQKPKLKHLLKSDDAEIILQKLDFLKDYQHRPNAEGLFFPATYTYYKGMSDIDILRMAHKKMHAVLEDAWDDRINRLPYKDAYEALVMASIIEKETGVHGERREIAGVFVRRLKKNMLLQTDPTVIYGMAENYRGNIRRSDLLRPTPYNTYVKYGLPPTPIALAGEESIRAALDPKSGDSLYFVADGRGGHIFSATLNEHNRAVKDYLKVLRDTD